ncbi:38538_t:CDS:2, partial [Gigaspora margarita]
EIALSTENGTLELNSQRQEPRQTNDDSSKESAQVELMASRKKEMALSTENGTLGLNSQRQELQQTDDDSSKESAQVELMAFRKNKESAQVELIASRKKETASSTENGTPELNSQRQEPTTILAKKHTSQTHGIQKKSNI